MSRYYVILTCIANLLLNPATPSAHAYETEGYGYEAGSSAIDASIGEFRFQDPGRRLKKFELALNALKIPLEGQPDFTHYPNAGEATQDDFLQTLRFIDPEGGLKRYLDLKPTSIDLFRDYFSHLLPPDYLEYSVDVRETGGSQDSSKLMARLRQIGEQAKLADNPKPLNGVRIIIDPGHMGNDLWDDFTGKFVEIRNKKRQLVGRVSEGQLTLWTAFLTANALEKLGAIVKVTREDMAPVSKQDYRTYDYSQYRNQYFYDSFDGWMNNYLHLGDQELIRKLRTFPEVKKKFPANDKELEALRTDLFIKGEDLEARARMISDFHPDLTIDIHYDASISTALQNHTDDVEGYVPGDFNSSETGSRSMKSLAIRHALESRKWNESVSLTSTVTGSIAKQLGLPLMDIPALLIDNKVVAVKVKNGVYARNLYITRRNLEGLVVYLECLHYDHTSEFYNLSRKENYKSGTYQGMPFKYPARIEKVAAGIEGGVVQYFKNLPETLGLLNLEPEQLDTLQLDIKKKF